MAVVQLGKNDRAFDLPPVLVQIMDGARRALGVVLESVGVQPGAPHELPTGAMKLVAAALENHVHDAAGGVPILRVIGVALHLELLDRIHDRHIGNVVVAGLAVVRGAIHQKLVLALPAAVDRPFGDGAVVKGPLPNGRAAKSHAGHHGAKHKRIARVQGQFGNSLRVNHATAIGRGRFEQRCLRRDGHGLALRPELELNRKRGRLRDL